MTGPDGTRLTLRQARAAARSVRHAELGREVLATVRPVGVSGIARARSPLSLQLYLASREGLLVWRDDQSFAMLAPRAVNRSKPAGQRRHRLLRTVDRWWDVFSFGAPPLLILLAAFAAALLGGTAMVVLLLVLAALVYVSVFLTGQLAMSLRWVGRLGRRAGGPDRAAAESQPAYQWSLPLLHQTDPAGVDDLLRLATDRVARIVEGRLAQVARAEGARISGITVHQTVVLLIRGVTTKATRQNLARETPDRFAPFGPLGEIQLVRSAGRLDAVPERPPHGGGFALLYAAGVATVIAVCATFVAADEAAICGSDCSGRPATWASAASYLGWRLLFTTPAGLVPAGLVGNVFGWLVSLLGLTGLAVLYVAFRAEVDRSKSETQQYEDRVGEMVERARVLLLVVTPIERDAVIASVAAITGTPYRQDFRAPRTVHELGRISNADLFLAQAPEQGVLSSAGMPDTARTAIDAVKPDYVVMVGICYGLLPMLGADGATDGGLDDGWEQMCDILVSRRVQGLDHKAVKERDGVIVTIRRGVNAGPSALLLDRCNAAQATWPHPSTKIHFGLMLCSNTLTDSETVVRELRKEFPDAIGGEMEATAVHEVASTQKVDWIMVKAISDWGYGKNSQYQQRAARNAADFVVHLISIGALDIRRRGRPGGPA